VIFQRSLFRCLVIVTFLFYSYSSIGWAEIMVNPHDFERRDLCSICHRKDIPKLNHDPITTCTKCHSGNFSNHPVSKHPIMVSASNKVHVPEGFPLTIDDKIVCYTCHDYHNTTGLEKMLWVKYEDLCRSCHIFR
jgi:predicted CXXCH cytochrome family protein